MENAAGEALTAEEDAILDDVARRLAAFGR